MSGADLSGTNLSGAVLQGADLSGACLRGSYVDETDFEGVRSDQSTEWPAGFEPRPAVRAGASTSELLVQVQNGHDQRHLGNVNNAQRILDGVWQQVEHGPQRFVRAVCALELAGLENDPAVALPWGLRALEEADGLTDADVAVGGLPSVQVLFPGLRLALAQYYQDLDQPAEALTHVRLGLGSLAELPNMAEFDYHRKVLAWMESELAG